MSVSAGPGSLGPARAGGLLQPGDDAQVQLGALHFRPAAGDDHAIVPPRQVAQGVGRAPVQGQAGHEQWRARKAARGEGAEGLFGMRVGQGVQQRPAGHPGGAVLGPAPLHVGRHLGGIDGAGHVEVDGQPARPGAFGHFHLVAGADGLDVARAVGVGQFVLADEQALGGLLGVDLAGQLPPLVQQTEVVGPAGEADRGLAPAFGGEDDAALAGMERDAPGGQATLRVLADPFGQLLPPSAGGPALRPVEVSRESDGLERRAGCAAPFARLSGHHQVPLVRRLVKSFRASALL